MDTGLLNVLIVTSALAALASYIYLPAFVIVIGRRVDRWAQQRVDRIVEEAVLLGVIPPAPDLDRSRPHDLDDCSPCEGTGLVQTRAIEDGGFVMWVTCRYCHGTGQRGAA